MREIYFADLYFMLMFFCLSVVPRSTSMKFNSLLSIKNVHPHRSMACFIFNTIEESPFICSSLDVSGKFDLTEFGQKQIKPSNLMGFKHVGQSS